MGGGGGVRGRVGELGEGGGGLHVLDVCLDEGSTLLDGLDDLLFASDCLVDESILARGELACGQNVFWLLLLAKEREAECCLSTGGCDEGCQQQTGGRVFPEDHDLRLLR